MGKLFYTQKIGKKTFWGASVKEAYLSACKWYASNVIVKNDLQDVQVEFLKLKDKSAVEIVLYVSLPEDDIMEKHCNCCKEMHKSFFINEDTHCDKCSAISFQKRLRQIMSVKISCYKSKLDKAIGNRKWRQK